MKKSIIPAPYIKAPKELIKLLRLFIANPYQIINEYKYYSPVGNNFTVTFINQRTDPDRKGIWFDIDYLGDASGGVFYVHYPASKIADHEIEIACYFILWKYYWFQSDGFKLKTKSDKIIMCDNLVLMDIGNHKLITRVYANITQRMNINSDNNIIDPRLKAMKLILNNYSEKHNISVIKKLKIKKPINI